MTLEWIKSSYSTDEGPDCVEVATPARDRIWVRDSKEPHQGHLAVSSTAWTRFLPYAGTTLGET
ncbi:DUF397 domain-containing protein [Streptomyces fumanus]|uniref:DUF397 domain-containing protein n=1 Tax=Streptomyces fumanus TaxID=67302 RepID=A0A919AW25_9ACTN|nr:DUF397 domain-containing protein [Streptomyces fumanus]GHF26302.1 hypothetical protein GCM10018772_59900 [Streptomyces fumanus]